MTNTNEDSNSSVRLRSIYISTNDDDIEGQEKNNGDDWAWLNNNKSNGHNDDKQPQAADTGMAVGGDTDNSDDIKEEEEEDLDESEPEPLTLPESTHTLFFTLGCIHRSNSTSTYNYSTEVLSSKSCLHLIL